MASCNLRNLFLEVWKLAQICHFWVGYFGEPEESSYTQLTWQKGPRRVGNLKILLIGVSHIWLPVLCEISDLFSVNFTKSNFFREIWRILLITIISYCVHSFDINFSIWMYWSPTFPIIQKLNIYLSFLKT